MKKIVFGGFMMFSGFIATAILMASGMMADATLQAVLISNQVRQNLPMPHFFDQLRMYQLQVPLIIFVVTAILGFGMCVWGLFEKQDLQKP